MTVAPAENSSHPISPGSCLKAGRPLCAQVKEDAQSLGRSTGFLRAQGGDGCRQPWDGEGAGTWLWDFRLPSGVSCSLLETLTGIFRDEDTGAGSITC